MYVLYTAGIYNTTLITLYQGSAHVLARARVYAKEGGALVKLSGSHVVESDLKCSSCARGQAAALCGVSHRCGVTERRGERATHTGPWRETRLFSVHLKAIR